MNHTQTHGNTPYIQIYQYYIERKKFIQYPSIKFTFRDPMYTQYEDRDI